MISHVPLFGERLDQLRLEIGEVSFSSLEELVLMSVPQFIPLLPSF